MFAVNSLAIFLGSLGVYLLTRMLKTEIETELTNKIVKDNWGNSRGTWIFFLIGIVMILVTCVSSFIVYISRSVLVDHIQAMIGPSGLQGAEHRTGTWSVGCNNIVSFAIVAFVQQYFLGQNTSTSSGAYRSGIFLINIVELVVLFTFGFIEYLIVRLWSGMLICNILLSVCKEYNEFSEESRRVQESDEEYLEHIRELQNSSGVRSQNRNLPSKVLRTDDLECIPEE